MATTLKTLNEVNGADLVCDLYEKKCLTEFSGPLIGVIQGIAYGGDVERLAKTWGERGKVYGFDTFEGHPQDLAPAGEGFERTCMDTWYTQFGMDKIQYDYQRKELDNMGLTNATLVKGLVTKDSCKDLPYINYAFIDMDILESMQAGYDSVKDKIVKGGYLLMHDINNISRLITWWDTFIKKEPQWEEVDKIQSLTGILRRK